MDWRVGAAAAAGLVAGAAAAVLLQRQQQSAPRKSLKCRVKHLPLTSKLVPLSNSSSFDHSLWSKVLKKYIVPGELRGCKTNVVKYDAGLYKDGDFQQYLKQLSNARGVENWPVREQLAFWLNAYNSLCLNHVVRYRNERPNDPQLEKLTDIPARLGNGSTGGFIAAPSN
jgi:hypothetical protein